MGTVERDGSGPRAAIETDCLDFVLGDLAVKDGSVSQLSWWVSVACVLSAMPPERQKQRIEQMSEFCVSTMEQRYGRAGCTYADALAQFETLLIALDRSGHRD